MPYFSLFVSGFVAATLLPASSELLLLVLLQQGYMPWLLWLAATAGNTLGSCVNWYLGHKLLRFSGRRWFPANEMQLERAQRFFQRYGQWSLLLAWLPVVGDPLTLVAGVMKMPWLRFVLLVVIGKGLRYAVLIFLASHFI